MAQMKSVEGVEDLGLWYTPRRNVKWYKQFEKVWQFLKKVKYTPTYDLAIPF